MDKRTKNKKRILLTNPKEVRFFATLGFVLAIFLTITFVFGSRVHRGEVSNPSKVVVPGPYDSLELTAKAAYVYDIRTGQVLFSKNEIKRLPLASLTKVMSALVALETAPAGTTIQITDASLTPEGDSGLLVGETWNLKDLLDFSLTSSSNDGMHAIALSIGALNKSNPTDTEAGSDFIMMMNKKARDINMKNTYYYNETGLDQTSQKGGAYGSAEDMAKLFEYILKNHPNLLEATSENKIRVLSLDNFNHTAVSTNLIVDDIPGIKASKTGFTDIAGGNLVVAFDPELGRPIIISVLGSTQDDRFLDMKKLIEKTLEVIQIEPTPKK
ncbi:MAG: hypothetical protein M3Q24_00095 [bacterium]|nr:hypothetical protein [bacterium]